MMIPGNLRQLRLACGMTQEQAAEKLHLTRQAISSYESGRTQPDVETLLQLAELYGTDLYGILYGSARQQRAYRRTKRAAIIVFILLSALTTLSSSFLWIANRFFSMPLGGMTPEGKEIFAVRQQLVGAWETLDAILLTAALAGGLLLVVFAAFGKPAVTLKEKLVYVASLAGALMLIPLLFGCTDPVFSLINYLITPFLVFCRLLIFLLVSVVIDALRNKKLI